MDAPDYSDLAAKRRELLAQRLEAREHWQQRVLTAKGAAGQHFSDPKSNTIAVTETKTVLL